MGRLTQDRHGVAERVEADAEEVADRLVRPGLDEALLGTLARTTARRAQRFTRTT